MLYCKKYISETSLLGIWQIDESKDELLSLLDDKDSLDAILSLKSEIRVLEMLAGRVLLKELLGEEKRICYTPSGKPYLEDASFHISISHTKKYVGVVVDAINPLGLDLEQIGDKIKRVRSRVVSDREYIDPDNEVVHLLLHWSAKEAMFKHMDEEGVNFLNHLFVEPFNPERTGYFSASETRTDKKTRFDAYYEVKEEFVLVCVLGCK